MKIKILGMGCAKCNQLAENAKTAATELNIEFDLEKVSDLQVIMNYGVMMTPALVIDDKVISSGKLLSVQEIKETLSKQG